MEEKLNENNFMTKLSTFIVDKRKAFFIIFIIAIIYSVLSMDKVKINNDITAYLPSESETRIGLSLMEDEFTTFATARVMVSNVTYDDAVNLANQLEDIEGVTSIEFKDKEENYKDSAALFSVTFDGEAKDEVSEVAMDNIKASLSQYDTYISSEVGVDSAAQLAKDMQVILVIAATIILLVLIFTSKTYMEIPVFLLVFGAAAILNKGTNYLFGEISFVTDSIAVVLQLALAIDYAIILCHRYMEEHETKDARESIIVALSKAIPEISASSLTTVSGMIAMMFMQFRIGFDMGIVLTKSILFSLLTVFLLMPGLIMMFSKLIDKTHHKNFVPKIDFVGKFLYKSRYVVPIVFIFILFVAFYFQGKCEYIYDVNSIVSSKKSQQKIAQEKIDNTFGANNTLAVLVPTGNYELEGSLLKELGTFDEVDFTLGLSNVPVNDQYVLTDKLTPRQFSELADLDIEIARFLYSAYAVNKGNYGPAISGVNDYKVPIIDMFLFLYEQKQEGYVKLDDKLNEDIENLYTQINSAKVQLKGENYSRLLLNLDLPVEGKETFDFLDEIRSTGSKYYDSLYLVGNSTSDNDLRKSFESDNVLITILTALFVMVILLFTFKSAGLPVLLVLAIQGSIWINFSFPYMTGSTMFFMSYLIVSAIQMGATIDYAIVITSRYMELKKVMTLKQATIETINQAFPTIFTSGSILTSAGFLIGFLSSDPTVASIGTALGRGTLVSIIIVLFALPQILLLGDIIIEKTAFTLKRDFAKPLNSGKMKVEGHVKGKIDGIIDAEIKGYIYGNIDAQIEMRGSASVEEISIDNGDMEDVQNEKK
ncbi:MAG: MMPL family transporter [Clostridium sp.]|nr:MMPL family transporter [Clostridium sp.]